MSVIKLWKLIFLVFEGNNSFIMELHYNNLQFHLVLEHCLEPILRYKTYDGH